MVEQIFEIIREINMALKVAHHAHVLSVGSIVLSGTGAELLNDDAVRKTYLGESLKKVMSDW
jgi:branched-chain amino acid transport system ATP-binding protein